MIINIRLVIALILWVVLVGCGSSMGKVGLTNDEIIKEVKKCTDNNMNPTIAYIWGGPRISAIICKPKRTDN